MLARLEDVSVVYGGRRVCGPVSFEIRRGERIALAGGNGSGKSSLIKLLLGENVPHEGRISAGSGLLLSYVPQDASRLCGSLSDYAREYGVDESLLKTILRKLGFERVQLARDHVGAVRGPEEKGATCAQPL